MEEEMKCELEEYFSMEKYIKKNHSGLSDWDMRWREGYLAGKRDLISMIYGFVKRGNKVTEENTMILRDEIRRESFITWYGSYKGYIQSEIWKEKATHAKEDAGWRCQLCNKKGNKSNLHAHHRTYQNMGWEEPGDIVVLCAKCHAKFHGKDNG